MKTFKLFTLMLAFIWSVQMSGQNQYALSFDGVDDYVDCGTDASLNITGPITVEAWIYLQGSLNIYKRIVEKDWATSYLLAGKYGINGIYFGMDPNGNPANGLSTADNVLVSNSWNHVAGTWDGATLTIYINGEPVASKAWVNASVDGSANSTKLGKYYGPDNNYFTGRMDEVRIWNVARTQQQIRDNMYKELDNPGSEGNLVAYYSFNEGSGQTSDDLSSNSNTAVLGGTASVESTDPTWVSSTAPIPYYSIADGFWSTNTTWAAGQMAPSKSWARVEINDMVEVNTDVTTKDLTVNTMGSLTVNNSYNLDVTGDFLVMSDASGTGSYINNGSNSFGNASIERYYAGGEWHLISSPISNGVSGMFTGLYLQNHTEATNAYTDIVSTTAPLTPMQGFALYNASSSTAVFTGTPNDGAIGSSSNLSRSGAGYNDFGWNLIGNPYPSSIDWDAISGWTKNNVDNATYVHVNASTWATYISGVGTNGGSQYIAPGQGFFVSVTDNAGVYPEYGTIQMNDDVRVHNATAFYKSEVGNLARLKISANGYSDETVVWIVEDATTGFDGNWDAHKLFGYQNEAPQIYSHISSNFSINAIPEPQTITIGVKGLQSGTFTIEATEILDIDDLYLKDEMTGIVTDLSNSSYTFDYNPNIMDERFTLHFNALTGVSSLSEHNMGIIGVNNAIIVTIPEAVNGQMMLYSIAGQLVQTVNVHQGKNYLNGLVAGAYIVKVVTDDYVVTRKVAVN